MKKNGTERTTTNLKDWNSTVSVIELEFEESGHPVFRASNALDRWFSENAKWNVLDALQRWHDECRSFNSQKKFSKSTQCLRAVADWCDELAQQIFDQSCSTIENSIAKVNEQLNRKLASKEVNTLVKALEIDVQASRKRLCVHQEKFAKLSKEIIQSQTCEKAGYVKKASHLQCFRTIHGIGDGFTGKTERCREYTHHTVTTRIRNQLDELVKQKSAQSLMYGTEIQVPSTLKNGSSLRSWYPEARTSTLMKLGKNKKSFHKTLRWRVQYKRWGIVRDDHKRWGIKGVKATGTIEHTDEFFFQCNHPLTNGSWMTFLLFIIASRESLSWKLSEKMTVFLRDKYFHREIDGSNFLVFSVTCAANWFSKTKVLELSQILSGRFFFLHRGSKQAQNSAFRGLEQLISCTFVPSNVTQEEIRLILNCWITSLFHLDGKSTCTTSYSPCTPVGKQGSSQVERTPKRIAGCLLRSSGPCRWRNRRGARRPDEPTKSTWQKQVENISGRNLRDQLGNNTK